MERVGGVGGEWEESGRVGGVGGESERRAVCKNIFVHMRWVTTAASRDHNNEKSLFCSSAM